MAPTLQQPDPWAVFPDAALPGAASDPWADFPDAEPSQQPTPAPPVADTSGPVGLTSADPQFADLPIPGTPMKPAYEPDMVDNAISGASWFAGAPVDLVNLVMKSTGLPMSEKPVLGSKNIEEMLQAVTGNKERRLLARDAPDVKLDGGAPLDQRLYSSFLATPKARALYLTRTYGPEGQGWYEMKDTFGLPTGRIAVKHPDGSESLFNPPGIDAGDWVSLAGSAPDMAGAIAGGAASAPAYFAGPAVGIPTSAVLSAGGAQLAGESIARLFEENRQAEPDIVKDVVPRASGEALGDMVGGLLFGAMGRMGTGALNAVKAPFASSASDPLAVEFRSAAERLKTAGYDISPLPSEAGAGGFIPRAEGLLEKLPGSSEKLRRYRAAGNDAIAKFQSDLVGSGNSAEAGKSLASELSVLRKNLVMDRESSLESADQLIADQAKKLADRQGPDMSAEAAGAVTKAGYGRARDEFNAEAKRLYDIVRQAPGGTAPIVDIAPVRAQVNRIKAALPPSVKPNEPDAQFTPTGLSKLFQGIDNMAPNITIDQARQMRSIIDDAIDDTNVMPGVSERYLTQLREAVSRAIEQSVAASGSPQLKSALQAANRYYRDNIDKFSRKGIVEAFRDPTSGGFIEDNQIVGRLLSGRGKPDVIRQTRDMLGAGTPEWVALRRNAFEQILDAGRSKTLYGRRVVDADGLVSRLNSLDDETIKELFGIADAQQLRNLAVDISNRTKYLDLNALSDRGSRNVLGQLKAAAVADQQIAKEYRDNVIAPFLRGENGAEAKLNAEELVPWLYRQASPRDIADIMRRVSPQMKATLEQGVIADIIEQSLSQGSRDLASVRRLVTGAGGPADSTSIAQLLGATGDATGSVQKDRIGLLLSPESRQALRDLALITARRQERDATNSAIGGLAAGAAIANMMSRPGQAVQSAVVARGLAQLITSEQVRKWLTNTRRIAWGPDADIRTVVLAPQLAKLVGGAIAEGSDIEAAINWLENAGSEAASTAGVRPPAGYDSWAAYFSRQQHN